MDESAQTAGRISRLSIHRSAAEGMARVTLWLPVLGAVDIITGVVTFCRKDDDQPHEGVDDPA